MVDSLEQMLYNNNNYYHPEIAYWLPKYIKFRGTNKLSSFTQLSPETTRVTLSKDLIGWKDFTEGKVFHKVFTLQSHSLACPLSRMIMTQWTKSFVSQILHITHAQ